jgi:FtsH-binding integral membrane protein
MTNTRRLTIIRTGIFAGAAGGLAEIAWVSLYAGVTGSDPAVLARGVTTAAGVTALMPAAPVALGIGVHMALGVMLGVVLAVAWQALAAKRGLTNPYPFMLAALAGVWAVNFFVVLPIVSPAFVHIVPYPVSLTSKLLFGVAAAAIVRNQVIFAVSPQISSNERTY